MIARRRHLLFLFSSVIIITIGCGNANPDGTAPALQTAGSRADMERTPPGQLSAAVHVDRSDRGVRFAFSVQNASGQPITLTFNTSQRFDYVLEDEAGNVVKRYSDGKMFLQVIGTLTLPAGDAAVFHDAIRAIPPGRYRVTFRLTANEAQPSATARFFVTP